MAALKLWTGILFVVLFAGVKAEECSGTILGPVIAVAVIIELVTVAIAVVSCLYLKIKLKRLSEEVGDQKPRLYSYSENGDDTIRVVHNTLYETLSRNRANKINQNVISETPVASASESHQPPASMSSHDPDRNGYERSNSREDIEGATPTTKAASSETGEPDQPPADSREDILEGLSDGSVTVDASITAF